ncbi:hypothetical protein KI387_034297, partial [Taxus chinensis]
MDNDSANYFAERGGAQSDAIAFSASIPKSSVFFRLNSDGHLMSYSMRSNTGISMIDYFSAYTDTLTACDYPRQCGGYGVCTDGQCSCPKTGEAFDQIDAYKPNFGCLPHSPLLCSETSINSRSPQGQQFLELEHVSYFTYCYENSSIPGLVSQDYCKNICFQNCSCKAAFFSIKLGSGGFGSVYEGILTDSTKIAVKQLDRAGQGTKEFRAEGETLGNIHHLNL